jgi:hypothetical protein
VEGSKEEILLFKINLLKPKGHNVSDLEAELALLQDKREFVKKIRLAKTMKAFQKRQLISQHVISNLKQRGFFITTETDNYFFWGVARKLLSFEGSQFAALLEDWYGINRSEAEWDYLINSLTTEAIQRGQKSEVYQFARYQNNVLYVSRFDGNVYRLDGEKIELVANGTDGVLFLDDPSWQPYEYLEDENPSSLIFNKLIAPINFAKEDVRLTQDEQKLLLLVWLFTIFFESLLPTKPILVFIGSQGSGKSSTLRWILKFLFGGKVDMKTLAKEKEDAFVAAVCSNYLVAFDNVDDKITWLNDHLATVSTGGSITLRRLYSTNEQITYYPKAFLCLTSRTPRFRREDVADRLLLFQVDRIENFNPESELLQERLQIRNQLWTEMLNRLNRIVGILRQDTQLPRGVFRMADFAKLAWRIANIYGQGEIMLDMLEKLELEKSEFTLTEDPFFITLSQWLEEPSNRGRELSMKQLWEELGELSHGAGVEWSYKTAQALGTRVARVRGSLETFFRVRIKTGAQRQKTYQFWPRA